MAGGKRLFVRSRYARQLACGVLGGLFVAPWGVDLPLVRGAEKSVLVDAVKLTEADATAVATDLPSDDTLQPIAVTGGAEPELADPALDGSDSTAGPTLAEEYLDVEVPARSGVTPAGADEETSVADDEYAVADDESQVADDASPVADDASPVADDVCIEEQVTPSGHVRLAAIQAASFNGATPGVTTRAELLRQWGQPQADAATGTSLVYRLEGFSAVTATFADEVVTSLRVELAEPLDPARLVEKLALTGIRPATVADNSGATISTVFPERGVTLIHKTADSSALATDDTDAELPAVDDRVQVIVLRPIVAAAFVLRAETAPSHAYACRIADLEAALRLDPTSANARWLLSQSKLATGLAISAETLAREAVDLEPRNDEFRLQWAKCLKCLARYDQAVEQTRLVLEGATASPLSRAQAMHQMGLLAALGSREVQERSVPLHNKAIDLADPLATSEIAADRIAAHDLLVGAHLAVAERIAAGTWKDKSEFVAQWISRASALAEQMIESGEADVSLRLQVANSALMAGSRLDPPIDPKLWVEEAEQAAATLKSGAEDDLARNEVQWQLGLAYLNAAEISHRRAEADAALKYGDLAEACLIAGQASRSEFPDSDFVLGRLYFQMGAVQAVHLTDHAAACRWYDRAIEPLSQPVPVTPLAAPGHHGDALVSMAVSYWEIGDRERAYELTGAGVELVEQGIAEGLLSSESLEVPQSNFLAMSRALGKAELTTPGADEAAERDVKVAQAPAAPQKRTVRAGVRQRSQLRTATRGANRR